MMPELINPIKVFLSINLLNIVEKIYVKRTYNNYRDNKPLLNIYSTVEPGGVGCC